MKRGNNLLLMICLLLTATSSAQPISIGQKIPHLVVNNLINTPHPEISLNTLNGKTVIIDFWATWCKPCLDGFIEFEKLQKKFGNNIQIIAVSPETPERLRRFIKNRPVKFWIASDSGNNLRKVFPYTTVPHTILIDPKGIVQAITSGLEINERVVSLVSKGLKPDVSLKIDPVDEDDAEVFPADSSVSDRFIIQPFREGKSSYSRSGGKGFENRRLTYINLHFTVPLMEAYGFLYSRVRFENIDSSDNQRKIFFA
jgi:peroxiredoxin